MLLSEFGDKFVHLAGPPAGGGQLLHLCQPAGGRAVVPRPGALELAFHEVGMNGQGRGRIDLVVRLQETAPDVAVLEIERLSEVPRQLNIVQSAQGEGHGL